MSATQRPIAVVTAPIPRPVLLGAMALLPLWVDVIPAKEKRLDTMATDAPYHEDPWVFGTLQTAETRRTVFRDRPETPDLGWLP